MSPVLDFIGKNLLYFKRRTFCYNLKSRFTRLFARKVKNVFGVPKSVEHQSAKLSFMGALEISKTQCSFVRLGPKLTKVVFEIGTWTCVAKESQKMDTGSNVSNIEFQFNYIDYNIIKLKEISCEIRICKIKVETWK